MKRQAALLPTPRRRNQGFALVVTLMLMILLAIIGVGLLSLSSISLRTNSRSKDMAEAQANARLALMIALGNLQKYAGPDQRVTANANLIKGRLRPSEPKVTNINWTGVWSTTELGTPTKPMIGANIDCSDIPADYSAPSSQYHTDRRNLSTNLIDGKWKTHLHLAWLVSGNNPDPQADLQTAGAEFIRLVGPGTLGTAAPTTPADYVTAPLVEISSTALGSSLRPPSGAYAYWVKDVSQSAIVNNPSPYTKNGMAFSDATPEGLRNLCGAAGPGFEANDPAVLKSVSEAKADQRKRVLSFPSIELLEANYNSTCKSAFHWASAESYNVICDVACGGLKKDITPYLELGKTSIKSDPVVLPNKLIDGAYLHPTISDDSQLLVGNQFQYFGPKFGHLRKWVDLKNKVTGSAANAQIDPQYPSFINTLSGSNVPVTSMIDLTSTSPSLSPVVTEYMENFDFTLKGTDEILTHFYPRVTLWNPYNVTLTGRKYLICLRGTDSLLKYTFGSAAASPASEKGDGKWHIDGWHFYVLDSVDFGPGECLVFVPDIQQSGGTQLSASCSELNTDDFSKNILSASKALFPGEASSFYKNFGAKVKNPTEDPPLRCWDRIPTNSQMQQNPRRTCLLKKYPSGTTLDPTTVWTTPESDTLQELALTIHGNNTENYWHVCREDNNMGGLIPYTTGRIPWARSIHGGRNLINRSAGSYMAHSSPRASFVHNDLFFYSQAYYDPWKFGTYRAWDHGNAFNPVSAEHEPPFRSLAGGPSKLRGCPFESSGRVGSALSYITYEVPTKNSPLFSFANLASIQFGYQYWQPMYTLGDGLGNPFVHRDTTVNTVIAANPLMEQTHGGGDYRYLQQCTDPDKQTQVLHYDMTYMLNQNLWDRYFLSSLPYQNNTVTGDIIKNPLPNPGLTVNPFVTCAEKTITDKIGQGATDKPFDYSAYFLMQKGAFNINCTNVEAWKTYFSMLNKLERPCKDPTSTGSNLSAFSRFLVPTNKSHPSQTMGDSGMWGGTHPLTGADINVLATAMVDVVMQRGPFLSLSDFINRRLGKAAAWNTKEETAMGAVQSAIEIATEQGYINAKELIPADGTTNPLLPGRGGAPAAKVFGVDTAILAPRQYQASGMVNQPDILAALGSTLTARGDSFLIRTYGESRDAAGTVTATAWCEAVVQRTPDYLVSTEITAPATSEKNNPMDPVTARKSDSYEWVENTGLAPLNRKFGRKFIITSFRWLTNEEI